MEKSKAPEAAATPAIGQILDAASDPLARGTKRKVSVTLDEALLEELRTLARGRPLSSVVNRLLSRAVEQERLGALVDELIAEAGEPPPEAYRRVRDQWDRGQR